MCAQSFVAYRKECEGLGVEAVKVTDRRDVLKYFGVAEAEVEDSAAAALVPKVLKSAEPDLEVVVGQGDAVPPINGPQLTCPQDATCKMQDASVRVVFGRRRAPN